MSAQVFPVVVGYHPCICVPRDSELLFFFFFARAQAGREILLGAHAGRVFFLPCVQAGRVSFLPSV
jgi:hypothetical protein